MHSKRSDCDFAPAPAASEGARRPAAPASSSASRPPGALILAAILAASALMLSISGYSFMGGNHEVYLLEPLKRAGLATFEGDWFVNQTLQYHGLFTEVAAALYRLNVARAGFLVIFLALLLAAAWTWWRIVRALGGDVVSFLVAVVLYHVLLGDRALGFYSLLQDGQFNAGNVASVALLLGIAMLLERRIMAAGMAFGVAGAIHLNYAVILPAIWMVLLAWERLRTSNIEHRTSNFEVPTRQSGTSMFDVGCSMFDVHPRGRLLLASFIAILPSAANIAAALPAKFQKRQAMPFDTFVDLYVHLRHTHHYDPLAWPWWVWAAFALPIPPAVMAWRRVLRTSNIGHRTSNIEVSSGQCETSTFDVGSSTFDVSESALPEGDAPRAPTAREDAGPPTESALSEPSMFDVRCSMFGVRTAWQTAARIWLILIGLLAFALVTAGLFWMTETFIQMSLWRFSPHAKLLAVSAAAVWLFSRAVAHDRFAACLVAAMVLGVGALVVLIAGIAAGVVPSRAAAAALALGSAGVVAMRLATGTGGQVFPLVTAVVALAALTYAGAGNRLEPAGSGRKDAAVLEAARWARRSAAADAIFLLPPDASAFSVHARRGQVVSFKMVPQLSAELIEWDRRLRAVLDVPDLMVFAGGLTGYFRAQEAMRRRYDELPSDHLFAVAPKFGARYIFRSAADPDVPDSAIVWRSQDGAVLYDLERLPGTEEQRSEDHQVSNP